MSEYSAKINILNEISLVLERYNIEITTYNGRIGINSDYWKQPVIFDRLDITTDYFKFEGINE